MSQPDKKMNDNDRWEIYTFSLFLLFGGTAMICFGLQKIWSTEVAFCFGGFVAMMVAVSLTVAIYLNPTK